MKKNLNNQNAPLAFTSTALVVNGGGFIGSFLCQSLLLQGCRVFCVDQLDEKNKTNFRNCFEHPEFKFLGQSVFKSLKRINRADYVFYFLQSRQDEPELKALIDQSRKWGAKILLVDYLDNPAEDKTKNKKRRFWKKSSFPDQTDNAHFFYQGVDLRIARLKWVYGPRMDFDFQKELATLIKSVLGGSYLQVPGNGDQIIYPVFVSDVVYGLTKAMFTTRTGGKIFTLIGSEKISYFDLAQKLKKLSGKSLQLKFVAEKEGALRVESAIFKSQKKLGWKSKVKINKGLKRTLVYFQQQSDQLLKVARRPRFTSWGVIGKKPEIRSIGRMAGKVSLVLIPLLIMALPLLLPFFYFYSGTRNLKRAYADFQSGDSLAALEMTTSAQEYFDQAYQGIDQLNQIYPLINLDLFTFARKSARLANHAGQLAVQADAISEIIFRRQSGNLKILTDEARVLLELVWRELSFLEADLESNDRLLRELERLGVFESARDFDEDLEQIKKEITDSMQFLPLLTDITGDNEPKTYLILFQNNMELRPTGGFIGSFALADFQSGGLKEFEVYDVYEADGQLKGHVEPPEPLKDYLGEGGWHLRDSNWDPNFPGSAVKAEWFLGKTLNKEVDGVIAINLNLVQKILEAVGPLKLANFSEEITMANLFLKAESYSEKDFFPGSTQKSDFLGDLARSLLERVKTASALERLKVARAIYSSLEEKDVLLYFDDPQLTNQIGLLGWEGSLREVACRDSKIACQGDYLMVVESNLGVNKANYYLKRNLRLKVGINDHGQTEHVLKISYLNTSKVNDELGGRYKNYLRIFLPLGSQLKEIRVDERILETKEIDTGVAVQKTYFGFLVEVPVGGQATVVVNYQPPVKFEKDQITDYLFFWQRQPGADPSRLLLEIDLPQGASVLETNPAPKKAGQEVKFEAIVDRDLLFQTRVKL